MNVQTANITKYTLTSSVSSCQLAWNASLELPQITAGIRMPETWPSGSSCPVNATCSWSLSDSTYAAITNGRLTGRTPGSTSLIGTALGQTILVPVTVTRVSLKDAAITLPAAEITYDNTEKRPQPVVTCGGVTLTANTDYSLSYRNNKAPGTATVTITGIGKYTDSVSQTFTIRCLHRSEDLVTDPAKDASCFATGLTEGVHCGACGTVITKQEIVNKKAHKKAEAVTKARVGENGQITEVCLVCGAVLKTTTIYAPKTLTLSPSSYTYNGKSRKPTVKIKDSKGKTIKASSYKVRYDSGRKYIGKYYVNIIFKGNYSGTMYKSFTIRPKATSISRITASSKGFTVKWKKQTAQTTGYQIQYSTKSSFKGAKTVKITKNKTVSRKISKLKAKQKYYVRVRTYKNIKVNNKTVAYYSAWSKAKTVKTKK